MPVQNLRFTFEQPTGLGEDNIVWSFGIDGATVDNAGITALADDFVAQMQVAQGAGGSLADHLQADLELILVEAFPGVGGPATGVEVRSDVMVTANGEIMPSEVQIVVTRLGITPRGLAPIGRLYVGPLTLSISSSGRPPVNVMTEIGEAIHNFHVVDLQARGYTPVVIRAAGTALANGAQIAAHRVDNAFDTQRRRGFAPTSEINVPSS